MKLLLHIYEYNYDRRSRLIKEKCFSSSNQPVLLEERIFSCGDEADRPEKFILIDHGKALLEKNIE